MGTPFALRALAAQKASSTVEVVIGFSINSPTPGKRLVSWISRSLPGWSEPRKEGGQPTTINLPADTKLHQSTNLNGCEKRKSVPWLLLRSIRDCSRVFCHSLINHSIPICRFEPCYRTLLCEHCSAALDHWIDQRDEAHSRAELPDWR